jgi:hypothetical protein
MATQAQAEAWTTAAAIKAGTVEYLADARQPRTHRARNDGSAEAHIILVQLLP